MSIILDGTSGITSPNETTGVLTATSINSINTFGFKNRIINGGMGISQRGTSATVTAGATVPTASTGYPVVDRFFVYSTGANVTAAQVAGSGAIQKRLQITGAASVTAIGIGQRIEQQNSYDLAGSTATLSVDISNSLLTTITWTASYATTTADTFGTIGTPTKTQIATGTFTVTSTVTNYNAQISIPAAATTGIEILLTVGAQTSGTWVVGNVQLEKGSTATSFDQRAYSQELAMCQRYYEKSFPIDTVPAIINTAGNAGREIRVTYGDGSGNHIFSSVFQVIKKATPTIAIYSNATVGGVQVYAGSFTGGASIFSSIFSIHGFEATAGTYTANGLSACFYQWTASAEL